MNNTIPISLKVVSSNQNSTIGLNHIDNIEAEFLFDLDKFLIEIFSIAGGCGIDYLWSPGQILHYFCPGIDFFLIKIVNSLQAVAQIIIGFSDDVAVNWVDTNINRKSTHQENNSQKAGDQLETQTGS